MRRNTRKIQILGMHINMLVLFVLEDLGEHGIDVFLWRPDGILVFDASIIGRLMSKEDDL